jgi:hypothetical protein
MYILYKERDMMVQIKVRDNIKPKTKHINEK